MTPFVQHQRTGRQLVGPRAGGRTPQARVDPCDELNVIKRNREAVIHAKLERADGVVDVGVVRPDDYAAPARSRLVTKSVEGVA